MLFAIVLAWPMDVAPYLRADASAELRDRHGRLLQAYLNYDEQWCLVRDAEALHPSLRQATVAVEDQRFYRHPGVDPVAVIRAAYQNMKSGDIESGASTLTMQLIKMHQPTPRTLTGKLTQAIQALRLDLRVDKEVLLTAYLNKAPYGGNLVGAEAAAQRYFGKPASELRLSEAALLAGIPKSPSAYDPLRNRTRALDRRNNVLGRMLAERMIEFDRYDRAHADLLGALYHPLPMEAPHLGARYATRARDGEALHLSLDRDIQRTTQRLLTEHVTALGRGIENGAVLVVDATSAEVLAHVGSVDFFNGAGGQVDVTQSPRSPGSTLKPFTYARAMEQQVLYPDEVLLDGPRDYGLYNPGNFDGDYYGPMDAATALAASRNIPALTVLERVGYDDLKDFLIDAGFTTLVRPASHYGLGLTLGNCEVRLDELVAAYTMLASGGHQRPLTWEHHEHRPERSVLTPDLCAALFDMLAQPFEEEQWTDSPSLSRATPRIAWKTGTSTGYRDAWAVLYDGRYVVGVWVGNNDGRPDAGLIGARAALPVAIRIFRSLPGANDAVPPSIHGHTRPVRVCSSTGLPSSTWCAATENADLPISMYAHRRCDVHRPAQDGVAVYEQWPPSSTGWDLANVSAPGPRVEDTHVRQVSTQILHPAASAEFILTGESGGDMIALEAGGSNGREWYWYVDGTYVGTSTRSEPRLWTLAAGVHTIACMDANGATDEVEILVRSANHDISSNSFAAVN